MRILIEDLKMWGQCTNRPLFTEALAKVAKIKKVGRTPVVMWTKGRKSLVVAAAPELIRKRTRRP